MTSKAAKKEQVWTLLDPKIDGVIINIKGGERRTLSFDAKWRGKVEAIWPQTGKVVFDLATGYGASDCRGWRLDLESARVLTGDPEHTFTEPQRTKGGKLRVYARPRTGKDQLSFFDTTGMVPEVPPHPPVRVTPSEMRKKAHAQLTGVRHG